MILALVSRRIAIVMLGGAVWLSMLGLPAARVSAQPAADEADATSSEADDAFTFGDDSPIESADGDPLMSDTNEPEADGVPSADKSPAASADKVVSPAEPIVEDSAAVAAIREAAPQTAIDRLRAVDQLVRLHRVDVAQPIWAELLAMKLDAAAKIDLFEKFGSAVLFRLDRVTELQPVPHDFVQSIFAAVKQRGESPEQLAQWGRELGSADRLVQYRAAQRLWHVGQPAIPTLVDLLAHHPESQVRSGALAVLQKMRGEAIDALQAYQASSDEGLRAAAITAQSWIGDTRSLPYLVAPYFAPQSNARELPAATHAWQRIAHGLPERGEAVRLLEQAADRAYRGDAGVSGEPLAEISRWVWSHEAKGPQLRPVALRDAAMVRAARLYRDLTRLEPYRIDVVQRATIASLEAAQALRGSDTRLSLEVDPEMAAARSLPTDQVVATLAVALRDGHDDAAVALCQLLGEVGDRMALVPDDGRTTALARGLEHPHAMIRYAAAESLAKLGPPQSFAGAGRWADTLLYLSRARGRSLVVVAHPQLESARHIGATFGSLGYQGQAVTSVKELWRAATSDPDVALIAISDAMNEMTTWSLIESLRVHPRTARVPIVILSRTANYDDDLRIADQQPRTLVLAESVDAELLATYAPRLRELSAREIIPVETRLDHANAALHWIANVSANTVNPLSYDPQTWNETLAAAMRVPDLAGSAAETLTSVASSAAQRILVNVASERTVTLPSRQRAAAAFQKSISQHGLLLTQSQIREQYDRYNKSRDADAETQSLLSSILDGIERHVNQSSRANGNAATGG